MNRTFINTYSDERRAASYASLEYPGTFFLAFRDLPEILKAHVKGKKALDFGCGAGRSTRFLKDLGYAVTGVDISEEMLDLARAKDLDGDYRLIKGKELADFEEQSFDLVLATFPFDNIPTAEEKIKHLNNLRLLLRHDGFIVNLVSSSDIYVNEWVSFSCKEFPENRSARSGCVVKIVMLDVEDSRPVEDVFWTHESYLNVYKEAGLELIETYRPLGRENEGYPWVTELTIAPWAIYVLGRGYSSPEGE